MSLPACASVRNTTVTKINGKFHCMQSNSASYSVFLLSAKNNFKNPQIYRFIDCGF